MSSSTICITEMSFLIGNAVKCKTNDTWFDIIILIVSRQGSVGSCICLFSKYYPEKIKDHNRSHMFKDLVYLVIK